MINKSLVIDGLRGVRAMIARAFVKELEASAKGGTR